MRSPQASWAFHAAFAAAFALGMPLACPVVAQTPPPEPEVIVYTTLQSYNLDIFVRQEAGDWRRVTTDQANDYNPAFSPDGRWLVFCSERRGNPDLYVLDLEGSGPPRPLTSAVTMEDAPAFSPDGERLLFVSDRHGNADVFVMPFAPDDPAGDRHAVNLSNHPAGDFNPTFSPDGERIAFTSERHIPAAQYWVPRVGDAEGGEIYTMAADGSEVQRLTKSPGWDGHPTWSADGNYLFFYSERDGTRRIWRMNANGSDQRSISPETFTGAVWAAPMEPQRVLFAAQGNLYSVAADGSDLQEEETGSGFHAPAFHAPSGRLAAHGDGPVEGRVLRSDERPFDASGTDHVVQLADRAVRMQGIYPSFPAFGPQGQRLVAAYTIPGEFGRRGLVIAGLDGSKERLIHQTEGQIFSTSWSPDGEWIVWAEGVVFAPENVAVDLWRIRPDGSGAQNLTASRTNDAFPDFAADGRIVFRSGRDGNKEIYLMEGDGTEPRRLTHHEGIDTMPAISPDGAWVVFSSDRVSPPGALEFDLWLLQLAPEGEPGAAFPAWLMGLAAFTQQHGPDVHPRFSPDGLWVVYASGHGGLNDEPALFDGGPQPYGELWVRPMFPFGPESPPVRLTHNKWEDSLADWARTAPAEGHEGGDDNTGSPE